MTSMLTIHVYVCTELFEFGIIGVIDGNLDKLEAKNEKK